MSTMKKVDAWPNELPEGERPQVIPGDPVLGDLVCITTDSGAVIYERYTPPPEPLPPRPHLLAWDALTFKRRFTSAERVAIRSAAKTNGVFYDFLDLLDTAAATGAQILATDPDVIAGLTAFEGAALIADGRAAAILSAELSP